MNRKLLAIVLVLAFAIMMLPISAVFAVSPLIEVSGKISSVGTSTTVVKEVGENAFVALTTASTWIPDITGGISGTTVGSQTWIYHNGGDDTHITVNVEIHFTTATVDGKTGTMTIEMNSISWPNHREDNHGTWRIKDAAGGLACLHGKGEWITYRNGVRVNVYEGTVHFNP